jgi:hypothetical protein
MLMMDVSRTDHTLQPSDLCELVDKRHMESFKRNWIMKFRVAVKEDHNWNTASRALFWISC